MLYTICLYPTALPDFPETLLPLRHSVHTRAAAALTLAAAHPAVPPSPIPPLPRTTPPPLSFLAVGAPPPLQECL
uniref:Uncharacterized protein n=1 Tax=Oryza rufipogon TaxID=4529 RepID=A0A0E0MUG8_ORYRU